MGRLLYPKLTRILPTNMTPTRGADVRMVKVKTFAYLERLKASFGDGWEDYAE